MRVRRRLKGFERVGGLPPAEMGMPSTRGRELALSAAWVRAAGEAIARRATAVAVRRGVLEIRVNDERWRETLKSMIPILAARLARQSPELGVKRFILRGDDAPQALGEPEPEPDSPPSRPAAENETSSTEREPEQRLADAMERYLESARRAPRGPARRP